MHYVGTRPFPLQQRPTHGVPSKFSVRTPATRLSFQEFRKTLPSNFNVVQSGGWYALEQTATAKLAARNFAKLRPDLPPTFDVEEVQGGWSTMETLAADPKGALVQIVASLNRKGETAATVSADYLDAILALLRAQGKGFESNLVDGEWLLVMQKQGSKSPRFQKLVGKGEKPGKSYSDFDVGHGTFSGTVKLLKGLGLVSSTVQYRPVADNFDRTTVGGGQPGIVLRRISCDIVDASVKIWKLPKLSLRFLRKKGGYLDFVYLDRDLRVTTGNRGGVFIHARPSFVTTMLS